MKYKKKRKKNAKVHEDLDGLDIKINKFGEIESNMDIDELNRFLTEYVKDKKLEDRDDLEKLKTLAKLAKEKAERKKTDKNDKKK